MIKICKNNKVFRKNWASLILAKSTNLKQCQFQMTTQNLKSYPNQNEITQSTQTITQPL